MTPDTLPVAVPSHADQTRLIAEARKLRAQALSAMLRGIAARFAVKRAEAPATALRA